MTQYQIRPVVATDISRLMSLDHTNTSDYVWQLDLRKDNDQIQAGFREVRLPRPISVAYPRDPFALADDWSTRSAILAALNDDEIVGYTSILEHSHATTAWIIDLVVGTESRRNGVGSELLKAAQIWAKAQKSRDIFLEMPSKNNPAIRLALKHGYIFCGYNDHYYVNKDVALFFGKSLL